MPFGSLPVTTYFTYFETEKHVLGTGSQETPGLNSIWFLVDWFGGVPSPFLASFSLVCGMGWAFHGFLVRLQRCQNKNETRRETPLQPGIFRGSHLGGGRAERGSFLSAPRVFSRSVFTRAWNAHLLPWISLEGTAPSYVGPPWNPSPTGRRSCSAGPQRHPRARIGRASGQTANAEEFGEGGLQDRGRGGTIERLAADRGAGWEGNERKRVGRWQEGKAGTGWRRLDGPWWRETKGQTWTGLACGGQTEDRTGTALGLRDADFGAL